MRKLHRDNVHRRQLQLPWSPGRTLSVPQTAQVFGCGLQTVRRMIERGTLLAYQLNEMERSPWRIYKDSVAAHIDKINAGVAWAFEELDLAPPTPPAPRANQK